MTTLYYTFLLRFGQASMDAALTLVIGVVVAGIFRRMIGPAAIRHLFGTGWRGAVRGWAAGMLLPVCSLGVIPVGRELRRSGVPGGTVLAFVLTGPLLNPISFLYGLTLGEPTVILTFAGITLAKTAVVVWLWNAYFGGAADVARAAERARVADAELMPVAGAKRILAVVASAAKELASRDVVYYGLGLVGNAAMACCLRHGAMQRTMAHSDHWAPLRMVWLSIPAYMSPLNGMMRIGSMFEHGNSVGAAFVLLVLGIGLSLGTVAWLAVDYGPRRLLPWLAVYVAMVLAIGYAVERPLWATGKVEADHTHAFDDLTSPFGSGHAYTPASQAAMVRHKLEQQFDPTEQLAVTVLLSLLALGGILRVVDRRGAVERWLVARPKTVSTSAGWDRHLSGRVIGGVAVGGLVAFSLVGAFVYYPPRAYCMERMRALAGDARATLQAGQADETIRYLEQWDLAARQLQVGVLIREYHITRQQTKSVDDLRNAIEAVRDDLRAGQLERASRRFDRMVFTGEYKTCRDRFGPPTAAHRPAAAT